MHTAGHPTPARSFNLNVFFLIFKILTVSYDMRYAAKVSDGCEIKRAEISLAHISEIVYNSPLIPAK